MAAILYLVVYLFAGLFLARCLLPRRGVVERAVIGLGAGLFLLMWLPTLAAGLLRFTAAGHLLAAGFLAALCAAMYFLRDKAPAKKLSDADRAQLTLLLLVALPVSLLGIFLEYTHTLRPVDGGYNVGQSTYGDLQLHAAITTGMLDGGFPLENSLMVGEITVYPYLADAAGASLYLLGLPLWLSMQLAGDLLLILFFSGYTVLCQRLCRSKASAALAALLLFFNGGLGFFYTLSGTVDGGVATTALDNLGTVLTGYYKTPTNQPDPNNLRFANIICDMLIPQRTFRGGVAMLMPVLLLLLPKMVKAEKPTARELILAGVLAGGLPLIHTHSYVALVLACVGFCLYQVLPKKRGERWSALQPWLLFGCVAAALSVPQLIAFTFRQTAGNQRFLKLWFNWVNNRNNQGLIDPYLWFYIKNLGLPYLLILLCLLEKNKQARFLAAGAFVIYLVTELVVFQPNEYDNGKLMYVWLLLCLPGAADYATVLYGRLKGLRARRVIACLFLVCCFLSAGLTVARECVSDYQAYTSSDVAAADFIRENTDRDAVFLTGQEHLNPASSLAGRRIVCGPALYLGFHGYDLTARENDLRRFYENPLENLDVLTTYGVGYIYVGSYERAEYDIDEGALMELCEVVYDSAQIRVYKVN